MTRTFKYKAIQADLQFNIRHDGTLTGRSGQRLGRFENIDHAVSYCKWIGISYVIGMSSEAA